MSFASVRDALIALSTAPGQFVGVYDIAQESTRRGTPVTPDEAAADLGTMHDYGMATKRTDHRGLTGASWDGLIVLAPNGDKATLVRTDGTRYPVQHLEGIRIEEPMSVHFYVVPKLARRDQPLRYGL